MTKQPAKKIHAVKATPAPRRANATAKPERVARIYLRVSTEQQDLGRQEKVVADAKAAGYYVAAVYREKASGAREDRPELLRMVADLQPGEVVIAESIDRITRLPLKQAQSLIETIRAKGARLAVPGIVDLDELGKDLTGVAAVVVESVQEMLLRVALQMARDDYEQRRERQRQGVKKAVADKRYSGRKPNEAKHRSILEFRRAGKSIADTASLCGCSISQVKRVCAAHGLRPSERKGPIAGQMSMTL